MANQKLFEKQLARGATGEAKVKEFLESKGNVVVDVSKREEYFAKDIDFIINGRTVELKTDYRINQTGNLFLEDKIEYRKGDSANGWFNTCEAEFLFVLNINDNELYIYNLADLRRYVESRSQKRKFVNDGYKRVYGIIVNKDAIYHETAILQ